VTVVSRYGRDLSTVFDLLGRHEPALTGALGWTLSRSPSLMSAVMHRLGLEANAHSDEISLKLETADDHGRTDIELFTSTAHVIRTPDMVRKSLRGQRWVWPHTAGQDRCRPTGLGCGEVLTQLAAGVRHEG